MYRQVDMYMHVETGVSMRRYRHSITLAFIQMVAVGRDRAVCLLHVHVCCMYMPPEHCLSTLSYIYVNMYIYTYIHNIYIYIYT